jgi:hypothetical protein
LAAHSPPSTKPKTIYCMGPDLLLVGKGFSIYRVV